MGRKRILNLTPQQRKAAELIAFNEEGRTYKAIAAELGVSDVTLNRWRANHDFAYLVNEFADQIMETFVAEAYKDLRKLSRGAKSDGSKLKAIELILKNRGKLHISATLERQFRDYLNTATAVLERKNGGI